MEKEQEKAAKAREAALKGALTQIERQFGQGSIMKMGDDAAQVRVAADAHGRAVARPRARRGRGAARADRRGVRPGVVRQDDAALPRARQRPEAGRDLRVHRRRARHGPGLREADRRGRRRAARLPAGPRRAGARDRRPADPLRRRRRRGDRLGGGAHAEGRARGRDGGPDGRPPGPHDVPGDAQAGRQPEPRQHALRLHQPDPREGRRDVRLARRRSRAAARSSSIPRSDSTSAGSRRSRRAPRRSATGCGSRW